MSRAGLVAALVVLAGCEARSPTPRAKRKAGVQVRTPVQRARPAFAEVEGTDEDELPLKRRPRSIVLAQARDEGAFRVADGFLDRDGVVEYLMLNVVGSERLRPEVQTLVDELLEEHRLRELTWRYRTDADRLDLAFAALEKDGVLARQRLGDCEPCGIEKSLDLVQAARDEGRKVRGFVFFHELDVEGITDSRQLSLTFGAGEDDEAADVWVGQKVVAALRKRGLKPSWNGAAHGRVLLQNLEWQKRRFTRAP